VVPAAGVEPNVAEWRAALVRRLPQYMVPAAFVVLEALPLTSNGKVDRKALPVPGAGRRRDLAGTYAAPETPAQRALAKIWTDLLGVAQVGLDDDFFELGGDSILTIQVIGRAREAGLYLTPKHFFQTPTLRDLADAAASGEAVAAEQGLVTGTAPLTPIQRWFFAHHPARPEQWNTSIMLELDEPLRLDLLGEAVDALMRHHDALRLRFERTPDGWVQRFGEPPAEPPVARVDLSAVSRWKQREAIERAAAAVQGSFDLATGPLLRVVWLDLGEKRPGRLLIVFHHLVADGVSLRIFLGDLLAAYRRRLGGEPAVFGDKTTSFRRWAELLAELAGSPEVRAELPHWAALADDPPPPLPVDREGRNSYGAAERVHVSLTRDETDALLRGVPLAGATVNDVLLAALARAVGEWTGDGRVLVEFDSHGRHAVHPSLETADLSRTIGWFTSVYPVRLDVNGCADRSDAVRAVAEQLAAVPNKGLGWGLLRWSSDDPSVRAALERVPHPEISFNYLGQFDQPLAGGEGLAFPIRVAGEAVGPEQDPEAERAARLYVVAIVAGGRLDMMWSYPGTQYKRARIERLAKAYLAELRAMLAYYRAGSQPVGA
jgi:non-ribosomal peptide synthase protein (TIGR01720 family)